MLKLLVLSSLLYGSFASALCNEADPNFIQSQSMYSYRCAALNPEVPMVVDGQAIESFDLVTEFEKGNIVNCHDRLETYTENLGEQKLIYDGYMESFEQENSDNSELKDLRLVTEQKLVNLVNGKKGILHVVNSVVFLKLRDKVTQYNCQLDSSI